MKISDMLISAILKKGLLYEARNCDVEIDIPSTVEGDNGESEKINISVKCKIEHMTVKIEKGRPLDVEKA